jgi:beta-lactamase class A
MRCAGIPSISKKKVIPGVAGILLFAAIVFFPFSAYSTIEPEQQPVRGPDTFTRLIRNAITGPGCENVSVYFLDPVRRRAYGVNEDTKYTPASLFKLPIMLALLKQAELDGSLLERELTVLPSYLSDYSHAIVTRHSVSVTKSYSIDSLLSSMILFSDNTALKALEAYLSIDRYRMLNQVYRDFHFDVRKILESEDNMSPKEYARFLVALQTASYLDPVFSEKALSLLEQSDFKQGLAANLPRTIKVAHKFGERGYLDNDTLQLHDCGIIYHPSSPYILCVMTRGTNIRDQTNAIASISSAVFKAVTVGLL